MIRAALHEGPSGPSFSYHGGPTSDPAGRGSAKMAATLDRLSGTAAADQLCAWAGRSGRRLVFSVIALDPDRGAAEVPLGPGVLVLAVRRSTSGPRRVLWAAAVTTEAAASEVRTAASALAASGGGELHCRVSCDPAEATSLAAEFEIQLEATQDARDGVRVLPTRRAARR